MADRSDLKVEGTAVVGGIMFLGCPYVGPFVRTYVQFAATQSRFDPRLC